MLRTVFYFLRFLYYSLSLNLLLLHLSLPKSFPFFSFILFVSSFMQAITSDSNFMQASCNLQFKLSTSFYHNTLTFRYFFILFLFLFLPLQFTQGFETLNMKREENLRLRHVRLFSVFWSFYPSLFLHRFVLLPPPSVALHIKFQTYVTP